MASRLRSASIELGICIASGRESICRTKALALAFGGDPDFGILGTKMQSSSNVFVYNHTISQIVVIPLFGCKF